MENKVMNKYIKASGSNTFGFSDNTNRGKNITLNATGIQIVLGVNIQESNHDIISLDTFTHRGDALPMRSPTLNNVVKIMGYHSVAFNSGRVDFI